MSTWTEVTGIIRCDWIPFSTTISGRFEEWDERCKLLQKLFAEETSPHGYEGQYIRAIINDKTLEIDDLNTIVLLGSLRDFTEDEINSQIKPWWENIMKSLPFVRQAILTCTSSRKTHIFEKRISSDFDLYEPDCPLWSPDPGILVHTTRDVSKKE